MKHILIQAVLLAALSVAAAGQTRSVCLDADPAAGAVLTICTYEHGMAPLIQPRLYLRLFRDGRVEYESGRQTPEGERLVRQTLRIKPAEADAITELTGAADLRAARGDYPLYNRWDDSSRVTTVIYHDPGSGTAKRIVLHNYAEESESDDVHYPHTLNEMMGHARVIWERAMGIVRELEDAELCSIMANPEKYINKRIAVYATIEFPGYIPYLDDPECKASIESNIGPQKQIGANYDGETAQALNAIKLKTETIRRPPFYGRARTIVTGTLKRALLRSSAAGRFFFYIDGYRQMDPIIDHFAGTLETDHMYAAALGHPAITKTGPDTVIALLPPLQIPLHHAARIEWTNPGKFPALNKPRIKWITFRVLTVTTVPMTENRWDTTYKCEILEVS